MSSEVITTGYLDNSLCSQALVFPRGSVSCKTIIPIAERESVPLASGIDISPKPLTHSVTEIDDLGMIRKVPTAFNVVDMSLYFCTLCYLLLIHL